MRLKFRIFTAAVFFIIAFNVQSVFAADKKISFEAESSFPPFSYVEDGTLSGFQIDLSKLLFAPKDYDVDYTPVFWEQAYDDVKSGIADTCGLTVIDDSRKKDVLFTKPILQVHVAIYIRKGTPTVTLKKLKQYSGEIGVVKDNFTESILKEKALVTNYKVYPDDESALNALEAGNIKVLFECQESINYLRIKNNLRNIIIPTATNLFPADVAFGVNRNDSELVGYINKRIDYLTRSGVYEELYENNFFTHSSNYTKIRTRTIIAYILIIIAALIAAALFIRYYINYLRKQLVTAHFELYTHHEWLQATLSSIGDAVIATDNKGLISLLNAGAEALTGFRSNDCLGKPVSEVVFLVDETSSHPISINTDEICSDSKINSISKNSILISKDGSKYFVAYSISPIKADDKNANGIILVIKDITEIKNTELKLSKSYENLEALHEELTQTEEELREQYYKLIKSQKELELSEERYKISIEGANDGLWDWDLRNKNLFLSPKCFEICGYEENEYSNNPSVLLQLVHPDYISNLRKAFSNLLHKITPYINIEFMVSTKNKGYIWLLCRGRAIFDSDDKPIRAAGSFTDITEMKKSTELIEKIAYTDSLTGLPNRTSLLQYIKSNINKATLSYTGFAVLFCDLDNFKAVNDTRGHYFGDELLKAAAIRLQDCIQSEDFLARLGGDEFMLILNNIKDITFVTDVVNKILSSLNQPFNIQNHEVNVSTSIGIALYPDDGLNEIDLIKNADTAMYKAKELGKNKCIIFSNDMNEKIIEKVELENYLRHAISKEELIVYYQPQIDIKSGQIVSMEALLRWKHPYLGFVSPDTFISLAEECGLIKSIGEWVLKNACIQNKLFQDAGYRPLRVAVNLSPKQFLDKDLYETIMNILYETGMKPEYLELEITESAALKYFDSTIKILEKLMDAGITISLDDFGTGYSSLNYLKTLPIDVIKIDKSFIQNIPSRDYEHNLTKYIISIAHDLSLRVVAEGVETDIQYDLLKDFGCDIVQGYLFSRPIPAQDFEKLLI